MQIAVYCTTVELKRENENLRLALNSSRETAARSEEDASRFRAEAARASAGLVDKERELQAATAGLRVRSA